MRTNLNAGYELNGIAFVSFISWIKWYAVLHNNIPF